MHVLVAGCGYVGSALGVRLAAEGHVVWGLRRRTSELPTTVRPVEGDLRVPNTLRNLPRVDQVFYLASPDSGTEEGLRAARLEGVGYLLAALSAARHRVRRMFYASSLAVYGDRMGEWVDEDTATAPSTPDGRWLAKAETLLADAPYPVTVVRFGEVYGPGRLGLAGSVLEGTPVALGSPTAHLNAIHRDDLVGALGHLSGRRKLEPLYLAVDREPTPRLEVLHWLASRLSRELPPIDASEPPPSPDVRAMSERLAESGYNFRYPSFREGFAPLLSKLGA